MPVLGVEPLHSLAAVLSELVLSYVQWNALNPPAADAVAMVSQ